MVQLDRPRGDVVQEVTALKERVDGDIVVYSSPRLVRTLLEHDLVDEVRLMTYPYVLGAGERLFGEAERPQRCAGWRSAPSARASCCSRMRR